MRATHGHPMNQPKPIDVLPIWWRGEAANRNRPALPAA
jgi:hypothetical protein